MYLSALILAIASCCQLTHAWIEEQVVLHSPPKREAIRVAVIGAGAAGASSAYHLAKFAAAANVPVNITVFERNPYIGGRSTTVNAYGDPKYPVELGGSIFVEVNSILVNATKEFNLSTDSFRGQSDIPGAALAVWDGQQFVISQNGQSWWDIAKLLWKYGLAPVKTMNLVKAVVGKFLKMYDEPAFPFASLTQVSQDLGLLAVTAATGAQYLGESGITGEFGREIVQASTRVNYAQNLEYIHGLEAMVSMAADNARSVQGGNWQIFAAMIKAANATTRLDTAVTDIDKTKKGAYTVRYTSADRASNQKSAKETFDSVVLAGPYQQSNISALEPSMPEAIPYVKLHVTLFTSPHLLSPSFFNLESGNPAPRVVLTTLPKNENARTGPEGVGSPGFFSISLLRAVTNPTTAAEEYLYKIFSASPPNSTFLADLLGLGQSSDVDKGAEGISDKDITWIFRKVWDSYPYEYPRVTFERIELDHGLWYTGGMDSFISTMETNALMGMNVARLAVDRWLDEDRLLVK